MLRKNAGSVSETRTEDARHAIAVRVAAATPKRRGAALPDLSAGHCDGPEYEARDIVARASAINGPPGNPQVHRGFLLLPGLRPVVHGGDAQRGFQPWAGPARPIPGAGM